ncbi:hypothetical protein [uncultured Mediterranean phage]|nr:hypothetical protein [uncultured Mediterranean phage]
MTESAPITGAIQLVVKAATNFLKSKGVDKVFLGYHGYGDSGAIEATILVTEPRKIDAPGQTHPEQGALLNHRLPLPEEVTSSDIVELRGMSMGSSEEPTIQDVLDGYGYVLLSRMHAGWEINEGSDGEIVMDLQDDKVTHSHGENHMHVEWSETEYAL